MSSLYEKPIHELVGKVIYDLENHVGQEERTQIQSVIKQVNGAKAKRYFINIGKGVLFSSTFIHPFLMKMER